MSIIVKLLEIYNDYGYVARTGLNPFHYGNVRCAELPFTYIYKKGDKKQMGTGGGISVHELYFLETLFLNYHPNNIFIIGNAFGWSSIALALLNPDAKIVALDAGIEGDDNNAGNDLTNKIAHDKNLNLKVEFGFSPNDVPRVFNENFDKNIDFVFIDGLHSNEQVLLDYEAVSKIASNECVYLLHDVVNWKMTPSFSKIAKNTSLKSKVLVRTISGMGILYPESLEETIGPSINAFSDEFVTINI